MKKQIITFLCVLATAISARAQDSTLVLTIDAFMAQIMESHPVARQASLLSDKAAQDLRISRGLFDPVLQSKFARKEFKGDDYYNLWDNAVRIPIWYGMDIKAGFERNAGSRINRQDYTPLSGLSYIDFSVPLGQGLVIDERRAAVRQAKLMIDMAEAERVKVINKLLLQAAKDYWDWMYYYNKWRLYKQGYDFALVRFKAVKERVLQGDMSVIDSVEAKIEVQNRLVIVEQASVEYKNAMLLASNYLWKEGDIPVELTTKVLPDMRGSELVNISPDSLQQLVAYAQNRHPDIVKANVKLAQLEIERKVAADKFKPKLFANYSFLQNAFPINSEVLNNNYMGDNYKLGISFSQPIFLRNERGKLQLTKLKLMETRLDLQQTNREVITTIKTTFNEWQTLENLIRTQENMVSNVAVLRNGELEKFDQGESTIFMINTREMSLINNQVKLFEMKAKYAKTKNSLQWAAGKLPINF